MVEKPSYFIIDLKNYRYKKHYYFNKSTSAPIGSVHPHRDRTIVVLVSTTSDVIAESRLTSSISWDLIPPDSQPMSGVNALSQLTPLHN